MPKVWINKATNDLLKLSAGHPYKHPKVQNMNGHYQIEIDQEVYDVLSKIHNADMSNPDEIHSAIIAGMKLATSKGG